MLRSALPLVLCAVLLGGGAVWILGVGEAQDVDSREASRAAAEGDASTAYEPQLRGRPVEADTPEARERAHRRRQAAASEIHGRLVDEAGRPIPGVRVVATPFRDGSIPTDERHETRTGSDGTFRFAGLQPRELYRIRADGRGSAAHADMLPAVRPGARAGDDEEVLLETTSGVFVEGTVMGPGERPLLEGKVRVWRHRSMTGGAPLAEADIQAPDGAFRLGPVPPGPCQIRAASATMGSRDGTWKRVTAPATGVVIVVVPILRGRVEGERLRGLEVICGREDLEKRRGGRRLRVGADDGGFGIARLPDAPHYLFVWGLHDDRYGLVRGVWPGDGPVVVSLVEGLHIRGRVVVNEGQSATGRVHVVSKDLGFRLTIWTVPGGAFGIRGLPPGTYTVSFSSVDRGVEIASQEVEAGAKGVLLQEASR